MNIQYLIDEYISHQPEQKRIDLHYLHQTILEIMPNCMLWFLDGKNEEGKVISNPNMGYGFQILKYADGTSREFYQIGLSANTTGISVYIIGLKDKKYLAEKFGDKIGKAGVTGYCIKFKSLKNINIEVLKDAIQSAL